MDQEILKNCMKKGFLLDKEMLSLFSEVEESQGNKIIEIIATLGITERVITKKIFVKNLEKFQHILKNSKNETKINSFLDISKVEEEKENNNFGKEKLRSEKKQGKVKLLAAPAFPQKKIVVKDFVNHFRYRYEAIRSFLEKKDFENLTSLRKIGPNRGSYTVIVMVSSIRTTKNKNIFIEVEDLTGNAICLVNQNKKELFEKAKDILVDDIIAINVTGTNEMLFANDVFYPEAALEEKKYSEFDEFIAFAGDLHAGSTMFLEKNMLKFIKWLNGSEGDSEQRAMALKVKYLVFNGDNIDGVGVYPGQDKFLTEKTSVGQYKKVEEILKLVRKDVQIIMCPGQHDAVWIGEPQPMIVERYAEGLHNLENLHLVPNPALIELDSGFKMLMYHGASINRFIDEIPYIRTNHGHMSPTVSVKEMIKRRHLAPMHGQIDYIPCENEDPLVMHQVPDIFTTGDQHRVEVATHNNILLVAGSCWQSITPFEEKVGNVPDPCKVPLFNLKTRQIKILDFTDDPTQTIASKKTSKNTVSKSLSKQQTTNI